MLIVRVDGDVTDCRAVLDEVLGYGRLIFDPDKDEQPHDAHARLADDVLADDRERPVGAHSVVMAERPELLDLAGRSGRIRLVLGERVVAPLADLHVSEVDCEDLAYGRPSLQLRFVPIAPIVIEAHANV